MVAVTTVFRKQVCPESAYFNAQRVDSNRSIKCHFILQSHWRI